MWTERWKSIVSKFADREYRTAMVEAQARDRIAFQVRALRQARGWSQQDLAARVGTGQGAISRLESLDYHTFSLANVLRVAAAFDVALVVKFASFGELATEMVDVEHHGLCPPDFEADPRRARTGSRSQCTDVVVDLFPPGGAQPPSPSAWHVIDASSPSAQVCTTLGGSHPRG